MKTSFLLFLFGFLEISCRADENNTTKVSGEYYVTRFDGVFGAEVTQVKLKDLRVGEHDDVIKQIVDDVSKHKLLLFRDQGILTGQQHKRIIKWFPGEVNCKVYHPSSPTRCIHVLSNDRRLGHVGRATYWHNDGFFREKQDHVTAYHLIRIPTEGGTAFLPGKECFDLMSKEQRDRFERLWYQLKDDSVLPMIIVHPFTGEVVPRAVGSSIKKFILDYGTEDERPLSHEEWKAVFQEMALLYDHTCANLTYVHHWVKGDFILTDNIATIHKVTKDALKGPNLIGIRVMQRISTLSSKKLLHVKSVNLNHGVEEKLQENRVLNNLGGNSINKDEL